MSIDFKAPVTIDPITKVVIDSVIINFSASLVRVNISQRDAKGSVLISGELDLSKDFATLAGPASNFDTALHAAVKTALIANGLNV